jgi:molybdopterin molybdotransferase
MWDNFWLFIPIFRQPQKNGGRFNFKSKNKMVTVQEATSIVLENCYVPRPVSVAITESVGRVLAEPIKADRDFPPFDRVSMDGIAINWDSLKNGKKVFEIEDIQAAGQSQKRLRDESNAIEVMTGAVLPDGADTVIRYEDITIDRASASVNVATIKKGENIHRQGQDARAGSILLEPGGVISPAEVALFASIGLANVDVFSYPRAAIVASGDELIDIDGKPEPHQIRRSNSYAIQAAMKQLHWPATQFHLPDNKDFLRDSLATILADHEVIILSGGVSKGKFDYVPNVLADIGVDKIFHEVSQRPGKPFWFGRTKKGKTVFALPGNPVSTFMCFHRYVKPWLQCSLGHPFSPVKVVLGNDFSFEPRLTYFLQVQVRNDEGILKAFPKAGGGSGDFTNLKEVDGFIELPLEKISFTAGETYPFIPFR